jgi:hypothetical protein
MNILSFETKYGKGTVNTCGYHIPFQFLAREWQFY